jgi:hypothetical protein
VVQAVHASSQVLITRAATGRNINLRHSCALFFWASGPIQMPLISTGSQTT